MISVIFPVFNCEEYLENTINSILNQKFKDFELLCIDNQSTDSSLDILKRFEEQYSRVNVFKCDDNYNLSYFINHCIEFSKKKYIYFLEPHFLLKNDAFEFFLNISENNNIDYLIFNYEIVAADNFSKLRFDLGEKYKIFEENSFHSDFYFKIPISLGNVFFSKSFLSQETVYFEENLYETFFKLRFNSQRGVILNNIFATVEKDTKYFINSIFNEFNALFSIFKWLFQYKTFYEKYKIEFLNFVLKSIKELYGDLFNFKSPLNQSQFYFNERGNFINCLIEMFDKFYFDYEIFDDIHVVDEQLLNFFKEFLINEGKYRLSIIIPVFNCESYIEDTLNSIINQSLNFKTIEVILVDDCSEDNSPTIIKEYSKKYDNIKSFFLETNSKYAGKPRNIALNNVSSNFVCFLDADDYYYFSACENLYYNMLYNNADLVIGNFSMDDVNGDKKKTIDGGLSYFKNLCEFDILKFDSIKVNQHILSSANVWNKMFKTDIIKNNDIFFLEGVPAQDSGFLFHYLLNSNCIIFINNLIVHYHNLRNSEGNKSVTHLRNYLNISGRIEVYYKMYELSLEYDVEDLFVKNILKFKLPYWFNQLKTTELSDKNLEEILIKYKILFEKCVEYNANLPKEFSYFCDLIVASNFEEIINEFKKIK